MRLMMQKPGRWTWTILIAGGDFVAFHSTMSDQEQWCMQYGNENMSSDATMFFAEFFKWIYRCIWIGGEQCYSTPGFGVNIARETYGDPNSKKIPTTIKWFFVWNCMLCCEAIEDRSSILSGSWRPINNNRSIKGNEILLFPTIFISVCWCA
jgi:hypothetical protein